MLAAFLLSAFALLPVGGEATIPTVFVEGQPFPVTLSYTVEGDALKAWQLGPAAFDLNGAALADRSSTAVLDLAGGSTLTVTMDLSEHLPGSGDFTLGLPGQGATTVRAYESAPDGIDFMATPVEDLANYVVLLRTNRGDMVVEFFPDSAPNHVRNFLDLSASGFYDGILFHRVSPTFMVQGGCPNTKTSLRSQWGHGNGPRTLKAETSDRKHVRGILSMARGQSPNSGSSQFFIMTATAAGLDHQYSVFGHLVSGTDALDAISNASGVRSAADGTIKPTKPQRIDHAIVLRHNL